MAGRRMGRLCFLGECRQLGPEVLGGRVRWGASHMQPEAQGGLAEGQCGWPGQGLAQSWAYRQGRRAHTKALAPPNRKTGTNSGTEGSPGKTGVMHFLFA